MGNYIKATTSTPQEPLNKHNFSITCSFAYHKLRLTQQKLEKELRWNNANLIEQIKSRRYNRLSLVQKASMNCALKRKIEGMSKVLVLIKFIGDSKDTLIDAISHKLSLVEFEPTMHTLVWAAEKLHEPKLDVLIGKLAPYFDQSSIENAQSSNLVDLDIKLLLKDLIPMPKDRYTYLKGLVEEGRLTELDLNNLEAMSQGDISKKADVVDHKIMEFQLVEKKEQVEDKNEGFEFVLSSLNQFTKREFETEIQKSKESLEKSGNAILKLVQNHKNPTADQTLNDSDVIAS